MFRPPDAADEHEHPPVGLTSRTAYDLVAVLLQVVEVLNLVLVALHRLGVGLLQVHVLHRKQLPLVVQDLVHLGDTHAGHVTGPSQ